MALLPFGAAPGKALTKANIYSPADFVVAPQGSGYKADYYTTGTNDHVQINAAITAANALTNGGTVELKNGTYTTGGSIIPLSNVWLRGENMFATIITTAANATYDIFDNTSVYNVNNTWNNAILSDFQIDGSHLSNSVAHKGVGARDLVNCKFLRIYCHDTTATGLGADDFQSVEISSCIVNNCGYTNKKTITGASWSANVFTYTIPSHGYSIGSSIVITGMVPVLYNGSYKVTSVPDSNTITIDSSNNSGGLNFTINPGTATTFGNTSDSLIGHNGIGIASGALTAESMIITNNFCSGNQNNNYLIEADTIGTGANASYIFSNNVSVSAGVVGYLNTGTPNTQYNNNFDYGSPIGGQANSVSASKTITAASWTGGVATFTTSTAHGYSVGQQLIVVGMTPSAYNGFYTIQSVPDSTDFTVNITNNPGTATVFGTSQITAHSVDGTSFINNIFTNNLNYGLKFNSRSNGIMVKNNVIQGCYNYGIQCNTSYTQFTGNRIYNNGQEGIRLITGGGDEEPMRRIDISNNHIYNNGTRVSSSDGIELNASTTAPIQHITIRGNHIFDDQQTQTQRYGVILRSGGTLSNISVTNNDLSTNLTGGVLVQNTGDTIYVSNNVGTNPIGKSDLGNISGSTTFDASLANFFTGTLTGNITAVMPAPAAEGTTMTWELIQDGTGSRTLTLPANATSGTTITLSTAAGAIDMLTWVYDTVNSKWRLIGYFPGSALGTANGGTGQTNLTNLPLTTPLITTSLKDTNGNPWLAVSATASAVGGFQITNNVSGSTVTLANVNTGNSATIISGSGSGLMVIQPGSNSTNAFRFRSSGGTNTHMLYDSSNGRFAFGSGTAPTDVVSVTGNVNLTTAGNKLLIATGSNASAGTGTLSGGTVTISTTAVTASSLIFITDTNSSTTNVGSLTVSAKSAGTSFTVTSTNASDTSTFNWLIIN